MAIRITPTGLQSFDETKEFRKKFPPVGVTPKPTPTPISTGGAAPAPKLPAGFIPDPTNPNQMIKPGTPTETRGTPEFTALSQAKARVAGNVPLPPETQFERDIKEKNILEEAKKGEATQLPAETQETPQGTPQETQQNANNSSFEADIGGINYKTFSNPLNLVPPTAIAQSIIGGGLTPEAETLVQTGAQLIDAFTSTLSARKSAQVTTAEGAMNDAIKAVNMDIDNLSKGIGDLERTRKNLINFEASINRLETKTKGLGKLNLRYWLGGGKEIEQEILVNRQLLEDLKIKLIIAEKEGRLAKARASFGR